MALEKGPVKLRTCKTGYSSAECHAQVIGGYSGVIRERAGGELILRLDEGDLVPQWDDPEDPV